MPDEDLIIDPFERSHVGQNAAFVFRVQPLHVEASVAAIRQRRLAEIQITFGGALKAIKAERKAA